MLLNNNAIFLYLTVEFRLKIVEIEMEKLFNSLFGSIFHNIVYIQNFSTIVMISSINVCLILNDSGSMLVVKCQVTLINGNCGNQENFMDGIMKLS